MFYKINQYYFNERQKKKYDLYSLFSGKYLHRSKSKILSKKVKFFTAHKQLVDRVSNQSMMIEIIIFG